MIKMSRILLNQWNRFISIFRVAIEEEVVCYSYEEVKYSGTIFYFPARVV